MEHDMYSFNSSKLIILATDRLLTERSKAQIGYITFFFLSMFASGGISYFFERILWNLIVRRKRLSVCDGASMKNATLTMAN